MMMTQFKEIPMCNIMTVLFPYLVYIDLDQCAGTIDKNYKVMHKPQ